mmetsp:Transcript_132319/g.423342  ORF Transcript_132319/g.423342 Transcript_132319/m.423342 type:complete len:259 (+) Transcript_132319:544-1320(+)
MGAGAAGPGRMRCRLPGRFRHRSVTRGDFAGSVIPCRWPLHTCRRRGGTPCTWSAVARANLPQRWQRRGRSRPGFPSRASRCAARPPRSFCRGCGRSRRRAPRVSPTASSCWRPTQSWPARRREAQGPPSLRQGCCWPCSSPPRGCSLWCGCGLGKWWRRCAAAAPPCRCSLGTTCGAEGPARAASRASRPGGMAPGTVGSSCTRATARSCRARRGCRSPGPTSCWIRSNWCAARRCCASTGTACPSTCWFWARTGAR